MASTTRIHSALRMELDFARVTNSLGERVSQEYADTDCTGYSFLVCACFTGYCKLNAVLADVQVQAE